jgi:RNA-directed DNA polymerase
VADTMRKNTNARIRGGAIRSSVEASVMGVERRDGVIGAGVMGQPGNRKEPEKSAKSFEISKHVVLEAYQRVKANRGAAGIDNESIAMFEANLKGNLYRIWNRMSSGSYFPPAVRQVEIAKKNGGTRILGVPTVADRVAQMVAKLYVEPQLEGLFHSDSMGIDPENRRSRPSPSRGNAAGNTTGSLSLTSKEPSITLTTIF